MTDNYSDPIDVWLRILDDEEESEAEANTYLTDLGYRVDWYLTAVGQVTSVRFDTLADAYDWLEREGFAFDRWQAGMLRWWNTPTKGTS